MNCIFEFREIFFILLFIYKPNGSKIKNSGPILRKSLSVMQGMRTMFPTVFNGAGVFSPEFCYEQEKGVTIEVKLKIVGYSLSPNTYLTVIS